MMTFEGLVFYRCLLCHGIVSVWDIKEKQSCPKCGQRRISPTNLSFIEMVIQIFKHPKIWRWKNVS